MGDSFHRGDWLSLAQSIASIIAIGGAFGVVFLQHHLDRRRERRRENEESRRLIGMAESFARDAYYAVGRMDEAKSNALATETAQDRAYYRARLAEIQSALEGIPVSMLATVEAARLLISVRNELAKAVRLAEHDPAANAPHDHISCGGDYGLPYRPIWSNIKDSYQLLGEERARFM